MSAPEPSVLVLAAVMGLAIGSFLNVVIYRLPRGISIVTPRSRCPRCSQPIRFYDNIPLLSFALLRGGCRACKTPIPWRYPLVEFLGLASVMAAALLSPTPAAAAVRAAFLLAMIAVFFIDLDHRIIPDEISIGGIVIGLLLAPTLGIGRVPALIGAVAGAGGLLLIAFAYQKLRGLTGMGGGDIKLAGAIGAFLGWPGLLLTLVIGSFLGSAVGIGLLLRGRATAKSALPFGCFLAPAAALVLLAGRAIWTWYIR